jgi:hypothetical protein
VIAVRTEEKLEVKDHNTLWVRNLNGYCR